MSSLDGAVAARGEKLRSRRDETFRQDRWNSLTLLCQEDGLDMSNHTQASGAQKEDGNNDSWVREEPFHLLELLDGSFRTPSGPIFLAGLLSPCSSQDHKPQLV